VVLSPGEQQVLGAFKRRLLARFGARLTSLRLFGSRARAEGRDDSDLDVLVELSGVSRDERGEVLDLAADLAVDAGLVISPLVVGGAAGRVPEGILAEALPL
jgi:predicted nucleotidyltransferase